MIDFGIVYLALKYIPTHKLPYFKTEYGNFGYILLLSFSISTIKGRIYEFVAHRIHLKSLGVKDFSILDPDRQLKMRLKREIQIVYENIINPVRGNMKRRSTLANLEISNICQGGSHRNPPRSAKKLWKTLRSKIKARLQVRYDTKVSVSFCEKKYWDDIESQNISEESEESSDEEDEEEMRLEKRDF